MDQTNFAFMFYGFAAAWLIVVAYLILLGLRERKLKRQLDQLKALVSSETGRKAEK